MNYKTFDEKVRELSQYYTNIEIALIYEIVKKFINIDTSTNENFIKELDKLQFRSIEMYLLLESITQYPKSTFKEIIRDVGDSFIDKDMISKANAKGLVKVSYEDITFDHVIDKKTEEFYKDMEYVKEQTKVGIYRDTYKEVERARLEVELNYKTPEQAVTQAVTNIAKKGVTSDEFIRKNQNGSRTLVRQGMEGVIRRQIRTTFTQTANEMQEHLASELGTEHWYVTQHMGARTTGTGYTNHAEWQGQVRTNEQMITICGEGHPSGQGFGGYNCRHIKIPHIPGISVTPPPLLDMEELERVYALEQEQRKYERAIRTTKTEINALELIDTQDSKDAQKRLKERLRKQQARLREYIKDNQDVLRRDYSREKVIDVK